MTNSEKLNVCVNIPRRHEKISEPQRFLMLVAGAFGCVSVSLSFGFNIFSGDMQSMYDFTQVDMSTISTVGIVLSYFGIPYAFVYDYFGLMPVLILGLILVTLGALLMGLTFAGTITASVLRLCVFNGIYNFGTGVYDLACVVTVLSAFPTEKGVIVAVMKTYIGLGAAIIGAIQLAFFEGQPANYFYFLMALGLAIGILNLLVLRQPRYVLSEYERSHLTKEEIAERHASKFMYLKQKPPSMRFSIGLVIVIFLILFIPLQSVLVAYLSLSNAYRNAFAVIIIVVWCSYFIAAMPFQWLNGGWKFWRRTENEENEDSVDEGESLELEAEEFNVLEMEYVAPQYQTTFLQSLCTLKLWAIFWSLFCTLGSGFVIMTNSRFFFSALSGEPIDDSLNTVLTVLNGVGSAVGRLVMSYFEVWSQKRKPENRIPITWSFFVPTLVVLLMQILFLTISTKEALPLPYFIGALSNGIISAVTIIVVNTIYARNPGLHYNYCFLATACSTIVLNRFLYGEWYTRESEKRGGNICVDRACVQVPLLVMLGLNLSAFVANAYVHWEYTKLNRSALAERRRLKERLDHLPNQNAENIHPDEMQTVEGKL